MKMWALQTLNSSLSGTVKGSSHPCKNLNISNAELKFIIYWQVRTIFPFLPTINTQMNMTEIMWTKILQETWHFEIR